MSSEMTPLGDALAAVLADFAAWAAQWGPIPAHPDAPTDVPADALAELLGRLHGNYPFFHPRYIGQMLKPPHPAAVAGYLAAMLHNPNNHALDGGPPTSAMEKELIPKLATMFGFDGSTLGHLTSSGTIANLEALFVARELHPGRSIAFSDQSHYTHSRMCHVLGVPGLKLTSDERGRLDLGAVEAACRTGQVGTVVVTAGTTGLGVVDPVADVIDMCRHHDVRVHVDAAYGGFFAIVGNSHDEADRALVPARHFQAIARADSVVVDPHKHGLQPYGCGAVVFADPHVARFFIHDSPYTYFTSDELHLGEISIECSRAGAAAAALWLTEQTVPWTMQGLGARLAAGCRAAQRFRDRLGRSTQLRSYQDADLDIVTYAPARPSMSAITEASQRLFESAMQAADDPLFLATYQVSAADVGLRWPDVEIDADSATILRSVLMKPENELVIDAYIDRLDALLG